MATIGQKGDAANHQYDLADFFAALDAGHFPAVAFLKPAAYQNGHAGYSDPIDEQAFLVRVLNDLQQRPEWKNTAVFLTWDDSDGWYDHLMGPSSIRRSGRLTRSTATASAAMARASFPASHPRLDMRSAAAASVRACRCW